MARRPRKPAPPDEPNEELFEFAADAMDRYLAERSTEEARTNDLRPDNEELLGLVRACVGQYRVARERATEGESAVVSAVRGARTLGVRAAVFKLALQLDGLEQRERDRWLTEFAVMARALQIPIQGQLGFTAEEEG